jgi:formamidase
MTAQVKTVAELKVESYTDVVGPEVPMLGPLADGGVLIATTANGCWGPMITPEMKSGHEVTQPVAVAGAQVGDAVALTIRRVALRSRATASGTDTAIPARCHGDPFVAPVCPGCGKTNPPSYVKGTGLQAIRCKACDAEVLPFKIPNGYTMVFDEGQAIGLTVNKAVAERIALKSQDYSGLPSASQQHSVLVLALADLSGILARVRPMIGNIGTSPGVTMPSSHNAGDFGQFLVGAPHDLSLPQAMLGQRTDGHMDIDSVGEGTVVICPVKVPGAGIYVGDVHAMQGDGEIAGHTTDVAAEVTLEVSLIKGLDIDGPVLLPKSEDLPPLARPYSKDEMAKGSQLAQAMGVELQATVVPVQVVGSGADLAAAVSNGIERLAKMAGIGADEIRNRITITGGIEIGRLPGVVQVTALLPLARMDQLGLGKIYRRQYGL